MPLAITLEPFGLTNRSEKFGCGTHRLLACQRLGIVPRTREWDGSGSLIEFIVSANLRRRHLKENQRAMIAARMLPHFEAEALKRKQAGGEVVDSDHVINLSYGLAREQAGKTVGVSGGSVDFARKILQHGIPELIARVDDGTLAVSLAAKIAAFPAEDQEWLVKLSRGEIANEIRGCQPERAPKPKTPQPRPLDPPCPPFSRGGELQPDDDPKIAQLIRDTQIGNARLMNTPQGLRLELPRADCLTEFYRLNRDRFHLLDLLERGVFIVIKEAV